MRLINISITSLDLMTFFQERNRIRDGAYVINLDDKKSKGTHWASLFIDRKAALHIIWFFLNWIYPSRSFKESQRSINYSKSI